MRRLLVFGLCFFVSALLLAFLSPPAAEASGWEWRQNDWSGGPGQAVWLDNARYSTSSFMDTTSVPGTMRMSYLVNPMTKDPANPVLAPGAAGAWDAASLTGYPMRKNGGGYEVLYRGMDGAGIRAVGYASSTNGVNWTKSAANPVLQRSGPAPAWDENGVGHGPLINEGDHYTMFFRGNNATGNHPYGRATSPNLTTWQRDANFVFGPGAAGSWEEWIDTTTVKRKGPGYAMWYLAYDPGGVGRIGYASSLDGVTWTRSAANPVLGPSFPWESSGVWTYEILERPWMGDYLMAYSANNGAGAYGIGIATSTDGVTWVKDPANPVLLSGATPWYQNGLDVMDLTFDGSMYKVALSGIGATGASMGQAYSQNGIAWSIALSPFLTPTPAAAWDNNAIFATLPFLEGNTLRSLYTGYGTVAPNSGIGSATSAPNWAGVAWLESSVFDAGSQAQWGNVTWNEVVPAGNTVTMRVRTGNVATPDGTWSAWTAVTNGGAVPGVPTRYIQYRVDIVGASATPAVVSDIAIDLNALPTTWYFAEGYTGSGFDEWITIQNPGAAAANVEVTYYTQTGPPQVRNHPVPANSRYTIYVNTDLGADRENSFKVTSTQRIIVERPMYFRYSGLGSHNWQGGHDAMGSTQLSREWFFAEGYTGQNFEEWITIQNPNTGWATVDVTYYVNGGNPIHKQHRVAPTSRYTISVNQNAGTDLEVSAAISSDQPILAERPMYFKYQNKMDGGHIVVGSPYLAQDWYLAEGATFDPFTEYITVQNPNAAAATVAVAYYTPGGAPITRNHAIPANSRYTINAGADSGQASDLSAYLHSNLPILVERPMYFDMLYGGLPGGHCAMGVNSASTEWYFGEGYTGEGFDEWLTVQNPGGAQANLTVTYYVQGGAPITRNHTVQPQSRYTINVGTDAGDDLQLSAYVLSSQPVICERPMYFFYQGYHSYNWAGGHDSQGFAP
jgi:P pilus assembly chaperone PapD